jgi:hypothetical protein
MSRPAVREFPTLEAAMSAQPGYYTPFRTSEIADRAAEVRNSGEPTICWFEDIDLGAPTFAFGPRFADDAADHSH